MGESIFELIKYNSPFGDWLEKAKRLRSSRNSGGGNSYNMDDEHSRKENSQSKRFGNLEPVVDKKYFAPYNGDSHGCYKYCEKTFTKAGFTRSWKRIQVHTENSFSVDNAIRALGFIHDSLESGIPILVGVDASSASYPGSGGNGDSITDHWILVVSRGMTKSGVGYFGFYEVAVASTSLGTSTNNKLEYNSNTNWLEYKTVWKNAKKDAKATFVEGLKKVI